MSDDIFGTRFYGYRTPAWHKLGKTFDVDLTASEAFEQGDLFYETKLCPYTIRTPWGNIAAKGAEGKVAIVRGPVADDPQPRQFAVVNKDYGLITNRRLAELLDPLSREWPVETVGALGRGERTFLTLRVGTAEVGGEAVQEFFLVNQCQDGQGGVNLAYTTVRVVCRNTLAQALQGGAVNVRHTRDAKRVLAFEIDVLAALKRHRDDSLATLNQLAEREVTDEEVEAIFAAAYPYPRKARAFRFEGVNPDAIGKTLFVAERQRAEAATKRHATDTALVERLRAGARVLYVRLNDQHPAVAGTAWAALNAVTELADHRAGRDGRGQSSAASALFGDRADEKQRAYTRAVALL